MNQLILPLLGEQTHKNKVSADFTECPRIFSDKKQPKLNAQLKAAEQLDLTAQWLYLINKFFSNRQDLREYRLSWSNRRQKRTLASCNIRTKKVTVAKELNNPEHSHILEALLYHEMCHAVLGYSIKNPSGGRSAWHGKEFKALESRHPDIIKLNLWIKSGGWRRAVRQDRSKFPRTKKLSFRQSSKISDLVKNFQSYIRKLKRC